LAGDECKDTDKVQYMIIDGELDHLPESAFDTQRYNEESCETGEKKCWQNLKIV
jgi:hypothetical protein